MELAGKTALVTGGSRGIGRAIVQRLARDGASVVFTFNQDEAAAGALVAELPGVRAVHANLEQPSAVGAVFGAIDDGLDILVNNAAVVSHMPIAELTEAEFDRVMTVNAKAPALAMRAAATVMRDNGRIINISSLNTVLPQAELSLYCASKAALEQLTAVAAREFGTRGITVNAVSPGATDTAMLRGSNAPEQLETAVAITALQRLGQPADIAAVVAFLAGPDSQWITGHNIRATGGLVV